MSLTTNQKGAISETAIAAAAARHGYGVLKAPCDGGRYDLVFDVDGTLLKVQCKWAIRRGDVIDVRAFSCRHTSPGGLTRRGPAADEIDVLAAYCAELDRCYALPAALVADRTHAHLRLAGAKNCQQQRVRYAADYEFPGAIAQLGERLAGSQKVAGSSPASSTSPRPSS